MIAYLDASILLRIILGQANRLLEWEIIGLGVTNPLVRVECLRTLDRLRLTNRVSDEDLAIRRHAVYRLLDQTEVVELSESILDRASQPFPTALGTLDALHLATALAWRDLRDRDVTMATHDRQLSMAARASGLEVVGV